MHCSFVSIMRAGITPVTDLLRSMQLTASTMRMPGAVLVFDVPLPHPGGYAFEIALDGQPAARVPMSVSQLAPPPGGTLH